MGREESNLLIGNESLVEEFTNLDAVVQFSDTIIFCPFIVFKYKDVLYFLVPDGEVDCC